MQHFPAGQIKNARNTISFACGQARPIRAEINELTNTGRDQEGLLAKTLVGLCTRVIAKKASHALKYVLNIQFGIKVQTFEIAASAA